MKPRFTLIAALCITGSLFWGCATQPEQKAPLPEEKPEKAVEEKPIEPEEPPYESISFYISIGDPEKALSAFEAAYSKDPESEATKVLYDSLLITAGKIPEAREVLNSILASNPQNADARYHLALLDGIEGNVEAKKKALEEIVQANPGHSRAQAALGEILLEKNDLKNAKKAFEQSLKTEPDNLVAGIGYGNILLREKKPEEAVSVFSKAIEKEPNYPFAYVDRSRAHSASGNHELAEKDITRAIELDPQYYWNYIDRGKLRLSFLGDVQGALEDFNKAAEIDPEFFLAYAYRAGINYDMRRYPEAKADYELVLKAKPNYYHVYPPYAFLAFLMEDYPTARTYFAKSFEREKEEWSYILLIGICLKREGKAFEAKKHLESGIQKIPRENLLYHVGRVMMEPGYETMALPLVDKEKNAYDKYRALFYLACHYLDQGKTLTATTYFREVTDSHIFSMFEQRLAEEALKRSTETANE
jgi:tetratricopeptide (TPR) repeat protein